MKAGVMKCLGSVQGLKASYGSGYVAAIRTSSSASLDDLAAFVVDVVPDAIDGERAGGGRTLSSDTTHPTTSPLPPGRPARAAAVACRIPKSVRAPG